MKAIQRPIDPLSDEWLERELAGVESEQKPERLELLEGWCVRSFPNADNKWLRFQIGTRQTRFNNKPLTRQDSRDYLRDSNGDIVFEATREPAQIFHLLGWGETMELAIEMAYRNTRTRGRR